jgi:hypothetical protein
VKLNKEDVENETSEVQGKREGNDDNKKGGVKRARATSEVFFFLCLFSI